MSPLMMGRAAAVRALGKGKADAAKAKLNARYGKQISMAVKAGGNDPVANRALAKLMEQAKNAVHLARKFAGSAVPNITFLIVYSTYHISYIYTHHIIYVYICIYMYIYVYICIYI
jgi:hypothetical protein